MNLFKISLSTTKVESNPLIYPTQLGDIHFYLSINKQKIENFKPVETRVFKKTTVSSWNMEGCRVEFLKTYFKPKIPLSMHVDTCMAGIWRIHCSGEEILPVFRASLNPNSSLVPNGVSETGEGLVSMSFENSEMQLAIGTEDEDSLNDRAFMKDWMPKSFFGNIFSNDIKSLANGIEVSLPCLRVQDCTQIQFIVASTSNKSHKDSCWFAVEQSPEYILKQAEVM